MSANQPGEGQRSSEYRYPFDQTWARREFLEAIRRTAPEVLQALREDVLPALSAVDLKSRPDYERFEWDNKKVDKLASRLRPGLKEWADRFHLRGPEPDTPVPPGSGVPLLVWMEIIVLRTLLAWDRGVGLDPPHWAFPSEPFSGYAHLEWPDPFTFETDGWAVLRETEDDFKDRLRGRFEKELNNYIDGRRREAEEAGWSRMPSRVSPEHFSWLVMFQILRRSHNQIAKAAGCKRASVWEGIHRAGQMVAGAHVDFWLMPPLRPGRRPGTR